MALSIQTNLASLGIQNQLSSSNNSLNTALERLGSGLRINSAADDAAGLQIANRLTAQVRGQEAARYNIGNATSMLQTAEGAMEEMTNIAYRMRELATQGANGTNSASEYTALNSEFQALGAELSNIMTNTSYGSGTTLLEGGTFGTGKVTFQIGTAAAEKLEVDVQAQVKTINDNVKLTAGVTAAGDLSDQTKSVAAMATVDTVINALGAARASFGSSINRLEHTYANLGNMIENTQSSVSQIMDADFATETSNMTRQQLLLNSGISVLQSSNQTTQMIGQLLR
ncbi:flagellin N-terminal helical domain-containing protein [Alteromonas sp. S015]|uniref:flagellin N-terminal helical domain-containing protein n=1 Tax=Alteromonas sp. S015 TaxID=3117401 RepID=UPI002FE0AC34